MTTKCITFLIVLGFFIFGYSDSTSGVSLSSRLVSSVCNQRDKFLTSRRVQPVQKKPPKDKGKVPCGKFQSQKCNQGKTLRCEENPLFKFRPCEKQISGRSSASASAKRGRTATAADTLKKFGDVAPPTVFIGFKSTTTVSTKILQKLASETGEDENHQFHRKKAVKTLREFALESQKGVLNFIKRRPQRSFINTVSLWLTNQIILKGADMNLLNELYENFPGDILEISEEKHFKLVKGKKEEEKKEEDGRLASYGVEAIEADKVWAEGNRGEGVIVGIIDTGVLGNHTLLQDSFLGLPGGWFDGLKGSEEPVDRDPDGHGTHVTGIIGAKEDQNKIGVAPGSKWMSCAACDGESCPKSAILKCLQWMVCPEKSPNEGINGALRVGVATCVGAPHVINNSWGNEDEDEDVTSAIKAIGAVGIIQVFAAGNDAKCETVGGPAQLEGVIAVGATTSDNAVAEFSSRGPPKESKLIKPDIVAPGEYILSTGSNLDTAVNYKSGTSQSAAHVTGIIALLLHEKPNLTLEQVKEILFKSAVAPTAAENEECGGVKGTEIPNFTSGHGLVNANKAVQYLKEHFKN